MDDFIEDFLKALNRVMNSSSDNSEKTDKTENINKIFDNTKNKNNKDKERDREKVSQSVVLNNANIFNDINKPIDDRINDILENLSYSIFDDINDIKDYSKPNNQSSNVIQKNNNQIDINDIDTYIPMKKDEFFIECPICYAQFDILDINNAFLDCNCVIHKICFHDYIINEVKQKNLPILCPTDRCRKEVNPKFITKCLEFDKVNLQKYEKFSLNNYMEKNIKEVSCCPTPSCEYLFTLNGITGKRTQNHSH